TANPQAGSAVTYRTTRVVFFDAILLHQLPAEGDLIGRLPAQIEDLLARPNESLRVAVAFQAPLHVQGNHLRRQRHAVDAAMARHAADALGDVDAVIEVDEVREVV